jgi:uncharacterized protein (TIGR02466 family)|tara:strand:- start:1186 stop:1791 length:606 start_codon:yes stop_codon:yes gene_type:complete
MKGSRDILFPTPLYTTTFPDMEKLNKSLIQHIKKWRKKGKGLKKTNINGWHSDTNMAHKKEYSRLTNLIISMTRGVFKDYHIKGKPGIGNMWANINYQGSYNVVHVHPNAVLSGSYYIQVPEKSGHIFFQDPRPGPSYLLPDRVKPLPGILADQIECQTPTGRCMIFPGWLHHGVTQNKSKLKGEKGWRISVAFNVVAINK